MQDVSFVDAKGKEIFKIQMDLPPALDLVVPNGEKFYKISEVRNVSDNQYEATVNKIGKDQI